MNPSHHQVQNPHGDDPTHRSPDDAAHTGPAHDDLVIGIDTGGTFTDGVVMNYATREVRAAEKSLTTRDDLSRGITDVLNRLPIPDPSHIKLVGISSTLATNSIAEDKTRRVGLLLIGYDRDLIKSYGLDTHMRADKKGYFKGGHTSNGQEKAPLDTESIRAWIEKHKKKVDVFAVSSYFSPLDTSHEDRVYDIIRSECNKPVVCGHQLSTALDSVKRAATAAINASLVAVMNEFIDAMKRSLAQRGIDAPLMIVKGDGALMPYDEAIRKPVETVLSGPAASAMGGHFLSRKNTAVMVDMGGTTTDIALVDNGRVMVSQEGTRVGEVETAIKAAAIRTACIGCDSRIAFEQGHKVHIGPDRVIPLCRLAARFREVRDELLGLKKKKTGSVTAEQLEYWYAPKKIDLRHASGNERRKKLIQLLNQRPMSLRELFDTIGVHHGVQLSATDLLHHGYIETAALAPTDLLHAVGRMDTWDAEVSRVAIELWCDIHQWQYDELITTAWDHLVTRMVEEIIVFLVQQRHEEDMPDAIEGTWGRWLFEQAFDQSRHGMSVTINAEIPVVGIGAPADIFVRKAADMLNAPFILPHAYEAANAVGAVAGSVMVHKEAILYTQETEERCTYMVQIDGNRRNFDEEDKAATYAQDTVSQLARAGAEAAGAQEPQLDLEFVSEGSLQRILAKAFGNPTLFDEEADNN
jgi:N-methylhydantoinase A/oxoprolinase/acetone carboxylase beta subunit